MKFIAASATLTAGIVPSARRRQPGRSTLSFTRLGAETGAQEQTRTAEARQDDQFLTTLYPVVE